MKKIEISEAFLESAHQVISYILETEYDNYLEFLEQGGESACHVYHHALIVNNHLSDDEKPFC
jgi:hypothetical protein